MNHKTHKYHKKRKKIFGTEDCPRLSVYRSNKYVYLQIIDDSKGKTILALKSSFPKEAGKKIAFGAKEKKIQKIVFDRGRYLYKGKVKEIAEGAREGGLQF